MKAKPPIEWIRLRKRDRDTIEAFLTKSYYEMYNKDLGRVLDLSLKMSCLALHDNFGWGEKRLKMFIAAHRMLFRINIKWVKERTQDENLNARLAKIFRKNGYPKKAFDDIVGRLNPDD